MSQKFPLKGVVSNQDYDRLIIDHAKDKLKNSLKIGDKVAYATASRWACPVSIGEVKDIILEYNTKWVIDVQGGYVGPNRVYQNEQGHHEANLTSIKCEVKLKGCSGDRGVTRSPS